MMIFDCVCDWIQYGQCWKDTLHMRISELWRDFNLNVSSKGKALSKYSWPEQYIWLKTDTTQRPPGMILSLWFEIRQSKLTNHSNRERPNLSTSLRFGKDGRNHLGTNLLHYKSSVQLGEEVHIVRVRTNFQKKPPEET